MPEIPSHDPNKDTTPEQPVFSQRVIEFVEQTAVYEGGATRDVIQSGVLTNTIAGGGIVLRSRIIDTSPDEDRSRIAYSLDVTYPGGCSDTIDIHEGGDFTYIFGGDGGGIFDDLDEAESEAITIAFFLRYNLDYYVQHPELWKPER